ncbi:ABC transporter permease [Streptomyces sp. NPDC001380]|uniref:ABC transporter permease n=1 Tax=Streptomyces sp. NPDC001380 TaxID=3364566 RepID=UPI0036D1B0D1
MAHPTPSPAGGPRADAAYGDGPSGDAAYGDGPSGRPLPEPPVQEPGLRHALASEWTKIRSVPSTVWTLAVAVGAVVGIGGAAVAWSKGGTRPGDNILGLGLGGFLVGQIAVIVLGVLTVTSEYGSGMIRTTLVACPRRTRVLTAKAAVLAGLVLVAGTASVGLFAALAVLVLGPGAGPQPAGRLLDAVAGGGLYLTVVALMSLAVGTLLRHGAGAIAAMIGFVLLPVVLGLFAGERLGPYLLRHSAVATSASLFGSGFDPDTGCWRLLATLAGLTAVLLAGAYAAAVRRDV